MKLRLAFFMVLLTAAGSFWGCSTKKDTFVNRNWHALNTRYNVLYNGELAFEAGRGQLNETYRDNYWELLPVERLEVSGEIKLDSEDNNPNFLRAEEKATKAIQKHSMDISNRERNPQTDESFLLLGKARYFDERYIPALEAFNYILQKYDASDKLNEASIWREKTHIRLGYEELALKNLKQLFKYEELSDQEYADARAIMGQAYINLNAPDTALQQLKIASAYTRKNEERGRYLFIIGQLYNEMGQPDSANLAFDRIIDMNRKVPRVYLVNAHLHKIRNLPAGPESEELLLEYLTGLETNRENRPFLDKIYRELAAFHHQAGHDSLALAYYNSSLRATQNDAVINALNYEDLANHHFDDHLYKEAGAYYDSVLLNEPENTRKFRAIRKKRENLDDVITFEEVVRQADSTIRIYEMEPVQRQAYFQTYIDSVRAADEAIAQRKEAQAQAGYAAFAETKGGRENQGKFYFYNIQSLGNGKTVFRNRWGERQLEDNWRWSNRSILLAEETGLEAIAEGSVDGDVAQADQRYDLDTYLSKVPDNPVYIDSLRRERNFANYQLGIIYFEKFREPLLAAGKLERVLDSNPDERLVLPSKYNLFKIYQQVGSPLEMDMREDIIQNHPDSRYASILLNPGIELAANENSPPARYAELYRAYEEQLYLEVITGCEESIGQFTGDPIIPKLELLKANAIGRLQGFNDFSEALNYVALNYPNTDEGRKAQQIINDQLPQLESSEFTTSLSAPGTENWKVVFPFKRYLDEDARKLHELLEKSIKDLGYNNTISRDVYNLEDEFVVVHGFRTRDMALGYAELLKKNRDYRIDNENFVILSSNYKVVQVHKNLQAYQNQIETPKP